MLELRELTKIYRPKKGASVNALKGVTLDFDDRGLTFILGKSGSGKSTLLNLIGGLDYADGGEIIIDGKSTKDFKEADYDSYRNTYIGFVFQEYNLLDEFTVGENVSLALELQGQKADKQKVEEILKQVDLEGYAGRKINELSGGQKQRVAIARAIVKDPKIIMADEPTGALDSATGRAILDVLKDLSKDRLVIVVSHDREFAKEYADRIIELADGEVIADEKTVEQATERTSTAVKHGFIKSRLPYKRALKMGARTMRNKRIRLAVTILLCIVSFAVFGIVDVSAGFDRQYTTQSVFLMGNSNGFSFNPYVYYGDTKFKSNSYGIYGSYDDLDKLRELTDLDFQGAIGDDTYSSLPTYDDSLLNGGSKREYYTGRWGCIIPAEQSLFDGLGFKLYGRLPADGDEIVITKYIYEQFAQAGIALSDGSYIFPSDIDGIEGFLEQRPKVSLTFLTSHFWQVFSIEYPAPECVIVGVVDTNADPYGNIRSMNLAGDDEYYNQICWRYFNDSYHTLTYTHQSLYDKALSALPSPDKTGFGKTMRVNMVGSKVGALNGVAESASLKYVDKVVWLDGKGDRKQLAENEIVIGIDVAQALWPEATKTYESNQLHAYKGYFFNGNLSLDLSLYAFRNSGASMVAIFEYAEDVSLEELELYKRYCNDNVPEQYIFKKMTDEIIDVAYSGARDFNYADMTDDDWRYSYACYLWTVTTAYGGSDSMENEGNEELEEHVFVGGRIDNVTGGKSGAEIIGEYADRIFVANRIEKSLSQAVTWFDNDYYVTCTDVRTQVKFDGAPTIVGIYYPKEGYPADFVINDVIYDNARDFADSTFTFFIAPMSDDIAKINAVIDLHYQLSNSRIFVGNNYEFVAVDSIANTFITMTKYLQALGVVLGIFSILLLGNYISASITAKKKEIGILRALGAKKSDIFAIFINECVIITAIVLVVALIGVACICAQINSSITQYGIRMTAVKLGIRQIAVMLAIGLGSAFVASALPLYRQSRKKPIDSIRAR